MNGTVIGSTEVSANAYDQNYRLISKQKNIAKDEDIKAVRFLDDMGNVVTYQQQDPLFSIDFSDPKILKVMDKIEMPGFSGYLHPVKDDLLLGIGEAEDGNAVALRVQVKAARRLPDLQGDIGIALLPLPLVSQDGPQNEPDQWPVLPQKRVQRSLIAARDLLHQYALVQPYLPPLLFCHYSILHHFRPKPTENFCGDRKMP